MDDPIDPAIAAVTKALDWNNHEYRVDAASGHTPYCRCGWKADRPYDVDAFDLHLATLAVEAAAPLIAAKALREAAETWQAEGRGVMTNENCDNLLTQGRIEKWLRARADALEAGQS